MSTNNTSSAFDKRIDFLGRQLLGSKIRGIVDAIIEVCDTAENVKLWFDSFKVNATAADIIEMTKVVLAVAKENRDAEERETALMMEDDENDEPYLKGH